MISRHFTFEIISFKNAHGNNIDTVDVLFWKTKYLIKISTKLDVAMANYDENDYIDLEDDDANAILDLKIEEED